MSMIWVIEQTDKFNPQLNMPLEEVTWSRDISISEALGMGVTSTSFLKTNRNAQSSNSVGGFPWLGDKATSAPTVGIDNERTVKPVRNLSLSVELTELEVARAQQAGEDVVGGKMEAMQLQYQFLTDMYVYTGATEFSVEGLINRTDVSTGNAANGDWLNASPDEIIYDITEAITAANANAGYAVWANRILLPPALYNYIFETPRASVSDTSILQYVLKNSVASANGAKLEIYPCKWLIDAGVGDTQRMVVYNIAPRFLRLPLTPIRPLKTIDTKYGWERAYLFRYGEIELVYPETVLYRDGI